MFVYVCILCVVRVPVCVGVRAYLSLWAYVYIQLVLIHVSYFFSRGIKLFTLKCILNAKEGAAAHVMLNEAVAKFSVPTVSQKLKEQRKRAVNKYANLLARRRQRLEQEQKQSALNGIQICLSHCFVLAA